MAAGFDALIDNQHLAFPGALALVCTSIGLFLYLRSFEFKGKARNLDGVLSQGPRQLKELLPSVMASDWTSTRELEFYKELYFKLQNLEDHYEIIPIARQVFLILLSQAVEDCDKNRINNILSIGRFNKQALGDFLQSHQDKVTSQYHEYICRRQLGGARELLRDWQGAGSWLREIAPLKLVDGAWLGHLNKITMPFPLRKIIKHTWQVFTEELGNGNQDQHHVKIFEDLLKVFTPNLPSPTTKTILHPRFKLGNLKYWRAAVSQLLVSLFPHDFLPEILGFNMHFEALQLDTMQAAKELPEVGLNAYYFLLHVSIDNGHSGHAAMAMESVAEYIEHVTATEGQAAADIAWKRVQAGYTFSEWQSQKGSHETNILESLRDGSTEILESKVLAIFSSKVQAAHRLHCGSRVRIGKRSLADWLDPAVFSDREWQLDFLRCLSVSKPWVYPGDSRKSRLAQELRWGGKMYGAFTKSELETLDLWINHLGSDRTLPYFKFLGSEIPFQLQSHSQMLLESSVDINIAVGDSNSKSLKSVTEVPLENHSEITPTKANLPSLLPLWFTQCCLLESALYAPGRTSDKIGCAVVRFLRAQSGFETEDMIVTGTDEPRTAENGGIVDFGLEMIQKASLSVPHDLSAVLSSWPSDFAQTMLKLSSRPVRNFGILLGASMAALELQEVISESSGSGLLSANSRERLASLVRRQYQCLQECLQEIPAGDGRRVDFERGYDMTRAEIRRCCELTM